MSPTMCVGAGVAAICAAFFARAIRRLRSPVITCSLECECGKIRGTVAAIRQDSIRIDCYCQDCRDYADFVAARGGRRGTGKTGIGPEYGESRIVQICKSAVRIDCGAELLQLARKRPDDVKSMHRYYAKCCHVPLMNTVRFLGFVGIFMDRLKEEAKYSYDGPVGLFPEEAWKQPVPEPWHSIYVLGFLWKLIRYQPYSNAGPFDYEQAPVYWGEENRQKRE